MEFGDQISTVPKFKRTIRTGILAPFLKSKHHSIRTVNITLQTIKHENISSDTVSLFVDPCKPLPLAGGLAECPEKSSICVLTTNWKAAEPRVTSAQGININDMELDLDKGGDTLVVEFKSGVGRLDLEFICNSKMTETNVKLKNFDQGNRRVTLSWESQSACGTTSNDGAGSFLGKVGWYLFTGLCVYFALGITYKAVILRERRLPNLIPNHEFWAAGIEKVIVGIIKNRFSLHSCLLELEPEISTYQYRVFSTKLHDCEIAFLFDYLLEFLGMAAHLVALLIQNL